MNDYRIIKLIRILSGREWIKVKKMASSPYFTSNPKIQLFFNYMDQFRPMVDLSEITKEDVFSKIFINEKYKDTKLRKLFSECVELIRQFLLIEKINQDEQIVQLNLLEIYQERKLNGEYELLEKRLLDEFKNHKYLSPKFLTKRNKLHEIRLAVLGKEKAVERRKTIKNLLEDAFIYNDLKMSISIAEEINSKNILNFEEFGKPDTIPFLIILYQNFANLTIEFDQKLFDALLELYYELDEDFPFEHKIDFYQYLQNAIIIQYNLKPSLYTEKAFKVCLEGAKISQITKSISSSLFFGLIIIGSKLKHFDWVEKFIKDQENYLPKSEREEALFIGKLNFLFLKGKLEEAFDFYNSNKANEIYNSINIKLTYLRIVFELFLKKESYYILLNSRIKSTKRWVVNSKKLSQQRKEPIVNFFTTMNALVILREKNKVTPKSKKDLKKKIVDNNKLISKLWFIEKVDQIQNRR